MLEPPLIDTAADMSQARAAAAAGYWSDAEEFYSRILSTQPGNAEALLGAAQMLRRLKNYSEAETMLDWACSYYPADPIFSLERARLADAQARYDQVFTLLTGLVEQGNNDPSVWSGILRSVRLRATPSVGAASQSRERELWLQRALAAFPPHAFPPQPKVLAECGLLRITLGRHEQGIALLLQANARDLLIQILKELPSTVRAAERSSALNLLHAACTLLPHDIDLLRTAARSFISLGQDTAAADTLARLLALDIDLRDQVASELDSEDSERAIARHARRLEALQLRFECVKRAGRFSEAQQVAEELLELDPTSLDHRLQLAGTYAVLGLFHKACDLVDSPSEAMALLNMNSDPHVMDELVHIAGLRWPESSELLLALARRQSARGELGDASWNYGRCLEPFFPETNREIYRELLLLLRRTGTSQDHLHQQPSQGEAVPSHDQDFVDPVASRSAEGGQSDKPAAPNQDAARESPLTEPAHAAKAAVIPRGYKPYVQASGKESAAKGADEGFRPPSKMRTRSSEHKST